MVSVSSAARGALSSMSSSAADLIRGHSIALHHRGKASVGPCGEPSFCTVLPLPVFRPFLLRTSSLRLCASAIFSVVSHHLTYMTCEQHLVPPSAAPCLAAKDTLHASSISAPITHEWTTRLRKRHDHVNSVLLAPATSRDLVASCATKRGC